MMYSDRTMTYKLSIYYYFQTELYDRSLSTSVESPYSDNYIPVSDRSRKQ